MLAYRSLVHESTGYTTQFLVHGHELSLPLDLIFPNPSVQTHVDVHDFVYRRKEAFQRAFELVRTNLNRNQKHRNAIYKRKVHGSVYSGGQHVLLHSPINKKGQTAKFFSSWRGT